MNERVRDELRTIIRNRIPAMVGLMEERSLEELGVEADGLSLDLVRGSRPVLAEPFVEQSSRNGDQVAVTAHVVGVYRAAMSPGQPPLVEIGRQVSVGDTLACLESMNLRHQVRAPVDGMVAEILAANGDAVEYGQPLMIIRP